MNPTGDCRRRLPNRPDDAAQAVRRHTCSQNVRSPSPGTINDT